MKLVSKGQLYTAHKMYNDYFFGGMLNHPTIIIAKRFAWQACIETRNGYKCYEFTSVWGYYKDPSIIGVTTNKYSYITLLHEMIHQYQDEFKLKGKDHGKVFMEKARYIEQTLNLKKNTILYIVA